jgi:hypothetical protein
MLSNSASTLGSASRAIRKVLVVLTAPESPQGAISSLEPWGDRPRCSVDDVSDDALTLMAKRSTPGRIRDTGLGFDPTAADQVG